MNRTHQAIFLALMMATMSLAGCVGNSSDSGESSSKDNETAESENELLKQQLVDLENEVFELEQRIK